MDDIALIMARPELLTALCLIIAGIILLRRRAVSKTNAMSQPAQQREAGSTPATPTPIRRDPRTPYEPVPALLTAAEREFFAVLRDATPAGLAVYPQVRLAGLVQVKPAARRDKSHWWRIQAKCLDFVLVDEMTFAPHLVVELDDSSHNRADRRERDAFVDEVLAGVGLPILHVRWQRRYDVQVLASQIAARLGLPAASATPAPPPIHTQPTLAMPPVTTQPAPQLPVVPYAPPFPAASVTPYMAASMVVPAPLVASRRSCGQCQAELREAARFCNQCGAVFGA
jgi:hypothetical protein